ncbi:MAG: ABC transporter substrate-binding protein [Pseudomonadota bacterium]
MKPIALTTMAAGLALTLQAIAVPSEAKEFTWAGTTDPQTMDPHAVNAAPVLGFLNNIYEGLVRRGPDMSIEPALAVSWEPIGEGEGWRFHLREGVRFHGGESFTADDVIFSYERASSEEADTRSWFAPVSRVEKVDDFTVDIFTTNPNPIFPDSIANWMIMDAEWAAANGVERPQATETNFATLNANGTGAYTLVERQPGFQTVLARFDDWWDEAPGNVTTATFRPVQSDATRVAALLTGEVDMITPVPIQDAARVEAADGLDVIRGIEARVIMLGFDQNEEDDIFHTAAVREAVAHAVDVPAILRAIMRGSAASVNQLVSPAMRGYSAAGVERPATDPQKAKALLAEAAYPDGIEIEFKCPNDRYLNDESVCQAVTAMLAKAGITANLETMPVRNYFTEMRENVSDLYLLGWSPGTFDHEHPIRFLMATPNDEKKLGSWNFGGYSNGRVDELLPLIQSEIDDGKRQAMIDEVVQITQRENAYVPLYVQPLVWAAKSDIDLVQRPDDFLILRWVTRQN